MNRNVPVKLGLNLMNSLILGLKLFAFNTGKWGEDKQILRFLGNISVTFEDIEAVKVSFGRDISFKNTIHPQENFCTILCIFFKV